MTLAQRIVIASDGDRSVMALGLAVLLLFGAIALFVFVGLRPAPAEASAHPAAAPVAKAAYDPGCAAALERARDTRGLPANEAIARSTAMLKACDIH